MNTLSNAKFLSSLNYSIFLDNISFSSYIYLSKTNAALLSEH